MLRTGYLKEYRETRVMLGLVFKKIKSHDEKIFIWRQLKDIARIFAMTGIVILPGGAFILALLETGLRRVNRTIMPSAFNRRESLRESSIDRPPLC